MKKHTFTLLLGWLLLLTFNLKAQNNEGLFRLKEGDWFEVQIDDYNKFPCSVNTLTSHLLRYQLVKILANNNQRYNVSIERLKVWDNPGKGRILGYDSYYPPFEENKATPPIKNQFLLEVSPLGKILRFTPSKTNKLSLIMLNEIGSVYGRKTFMMGEQDMKDSLTVRNLSNIFMLPVGHTDFKNQTEVYKYSTAKQINRIKTQNSGVTNVEVLFKDSLKVKIPYQTITGIPLFIKLPDMEFVITKASFPLDNNTIVFGQLEDQPNMNIRIDLIGNSSLFSFTTNAFQTKNDGTFNCPIFLERPIHLSIQIGNKNLTTFLEPGDTLHFNEIGYLAHKLSPVDFKDTNQVEYESNIKNKAECFSGSAEYNTLLSNEINHYRNYSRIFRSNQSIIKYNKTTNIIVDKLINSYTGKASKVFLDYSRKDWNYYSAAEKLQFYKERKIPAGKNTYKDVLTIKDFPADFFLGVDTLPILMNPFEWNNSYLDFLEKAQNFKQERLGYSVGKWIHRNFLENYFFSQASLSGFPLYYQISRFIEFEYRHGTTEEDFLEPFYQDFINNCANPFLTESLKRVHENAMLTKADTLFPIKSFVLQDHSIFKLEKLKGKPTCIIIFSGIHSKINLYKYLIKKYENEDVAFLFVKLHNYYSYDEKIDSTILKKRNVAIIEVSDSTLHDKLLLNANKIFILDKWLRIVDNKAGNALTFQETEVYSTIDKSLRKAIDAKRYSKAEQSAILKTAGWSLGSIIFTLLVGWWIYRFRIRQIKQQEEAKRRIKELEIKAIRSQMNPHFIFNALNSIQSLINSNQFKEANIYLSKFAVLLRGVLNNSEKSRVSLSDELQAVELYCQLEQLRFDFHFDINIAEDVNGDLIEIPGMIIQPLAENAVVHGISAKGNEGKLNIKVSRQNGNV
ncbi:MAG: sensor histidine kinase, partial [Methanococcaceae archaeon]